MFCSRTVRCRISVWLLALPGVGAAATCSVVNGQDLSRQVARYLDSGEFGPALAAAKRIENPDLRDQQLTHIAAVQAAMNAPRASLATLLQVQGDRQRSRAASEIQGQPVGARGGAALADFDTLIDLITSTIAPDSWTDVGGTGAIEPFPTGVYVDPTGVLKRLAPRESTPLLADVRRRSRVDSGNRHVQRAARLRKVSLTRLEKQLVARRAIGQGPDEAMRVLAGIYRLEYVLVFPKTGDIVLAGPAGEWKRNREERIVNASNGRPVLQLDDWVVLLRNAIEHQGKFGCAIKPKQENLAATKAFVDRWRTRAVKPTQRKKWLADLQATLGSQDVDFWGIDPRTRVARVLLESDYRMKLIGMGLEEGTLGVISYLDAAKEAGSQNPPSMNVLRWWFALQYQGIETTLEHDAYVFKGPGVQVLSENELLTRTGKRIHTSTSDELNRSFARSFSKQFNVLAAKYPIYADLKNIFDLALAANLLLAEDLPEKTGWHMVYFRDPDACRVALGPAPREVPSVANSVMVNRHRFLAGVSGGVSVDCGQLARPDHMVTNTYGSLDAEHAGATPKTMPPDAWWWD